MALQALAKYGAATYSTNGVTTVRVTSLGGLNIEFTVDQSNRLLFQEERLSEAPGEYIVRAEGQSCVLAQVIRARELLTPNTFNYNHHFFPILVKLGGYVDS